jgi:hypothetical protein
MTTSRRESGCTGGNQPLPRIPTRVAASAFRGRPAVTWGLANPIRVSSSTNPNRSLPCNSGASYTVSGDFMKNLEKSSEAKARAAWSGVGKASFAARMIHF